MSVNSKDKMASPGGGGVGFAAEADYSKWFLKFSFLVGMFYILSLAFRSLMFFMATFGFRFGIVGVVQAGFSLSLLFIAFFGFLFFFLFIANRCIRLRIGFCRGCSSKNCQSASKKT